MIFWFCLFLTLSKVLSWRFFIIIIDAISMGTGYFTNKSTCCNITFGRGSFYVSKLFNYLGFYMVLFSKAIYFFWNGQIDFRFAGSSVFVISSKCFLITKNCSLTNSCKAVNSIVKFSIFSWYLWILAPSSKLVTVRHSSSKVYFELDLRSMRSIFDGVFNFTYGVQ